MTRSSRPKSSFSSSTKQKAFERAGGKCERCGASLESRRHARFHHKVPRTRGGTNELSNCEVLCLKCHDTEAGFLISHGRRVAPRHFFIKGLSKADARRRAGIARVIAEAQIRAGLPFETILDE